MERLIVQIEKLNNIENVYLNNLHKHEIFCTVYLVNGIKLQGVIIFFDNISLLIQREKSNPMLIYKHSISTITTHDFLNAA